ncbi:aldo/keto reductase [Sphingomonas sp. Root710]|uniref:aldo/keto reductase n=1 Tax=Sphingomonas sp. Root710 TaxID=1736594 RepID=UPI0009EC4425|nr:aldo/keto reductase [Sphingomonas sp. Root710]
MVSKRKVGPFSVNPIGLGCMSLSHAYGPPVDAAEGLRLLNRALDIGYDFLDTAALYGSGRNESLLAGIKGRRSEYVLASKCGFAAAGGGRVIDGSPAAIAEVLDLSLQRLETDHIDLYYLHRPDPRVPIEESVGALARAVEAGKIGTIGLSEISADQLRRAHAVHPITALQTEYSLWTRNPEIAVLDACRELGIAFVAFSPVARGFLAGAIGPGHQYAEGDIRTGMPRFIEPDVTANLALLDGYHALAAEIGCTPAQLALAWLLHRDPDLVTIPGTANIAHLEENIAAGEIRLTAEQAAAADALINRRTVSGSRYNAAAQSSVTTEEFV